jgi:hypothetical protein
MLVFGNPNASASTEEPRKSYVVYLRSVTFYLASWSDCDMYFLRGSR